MKINKVKFAPIFLAIAVLHSARVAAADQIYSLMPNNALSGVISPMMLDRTSIRKAWPKTPANPNHLKIGWTEITMGAPWFVGLAHGVKRMQERYGLDIAMEVADGNLQTQCSQIDDFITRKMDIIVVDPTDVLGVVECINRAVDAGIPVITVGTVPDSNSRVLTTITANPYATGFAVGEYVAKDAGNNTPIVAAAIIGVIGNSTSESRVNGMISGIVYERSAEMGKPLTRPEAMLHGFYLFETLKKTGHLNDPQSKLKVVSLAEGHWNKEGGLSAAEDILSAHGDQLNYFLTDNDSMGLGALHAINDIGKGGQIKIASPADGTKEAMAQVKAGNLLVTGMASGDETGAAAVELIHNLFTGKVDGSDLPMGSYFPVGLITRQSVDADTDPNPDNLFYKYTIPPVKSIPEIKASLAADAK